MDTQPANAVELWSVNQLGERYRRYRLPDEKAEMILARSLRCFGQLAAVVVCRRAESVEVVDGFKRLGAARTLGWKTVWIRWLEADERAAKAAIYSLNQIGQRPREWEEAWIVHALVREDGLSQVEVAALLGRHKSWVCRRLALIEKLADSVKEELRLGLLSLRQARQLQRLPTGNQPDVLQVVRNQSLTVDELQGIADLFLTAGSKVQEEFILQNPREALQRARAVPVPIRDPRLSPAGNRASRMIHHGLEVLTRLTRWLSASGFGELRLSDRALLAGALLRLGHEAQALAEQMENLPELHHDGINP